jgi:hypothetical protein
MSKIKTNKLSKPVVIDMWESPVSMGPKRLTSKYMLVADAIFELQPQSIIQKITISPEVEQAIIKRLVAAGYSKHNTIKTYADRLTKGIQSSEFGWAKRYPELCAQIDLLRAKYIKQYFKRF